MASIIIALSVAFFPVVYLNCCMGWIACLWSNFFHWFILVVVQSPYMRLIVIRPTLLTSARIWGRRDAWALSPSMRTANFCCSDCSTWPIVVGAQLITRMWNLLHYRRQIQTWQPEIRHILLMPTVRGTPARQSRAEIANPEGLHLQIIHVAF